MSAQRRGPKLKDPEVKKPGSIINDINKLKKMYKEERKKEKPDKSRISELQNQVLELEGILTRRNITFTPTIFSVDTGIQTETELPTDEQGHRELDTLQQENENIEPTPEGEGASTSLLEPKTRVKSSIPPYDIQIKERLDLLERQNKYIHDQNQFLRRNEPRRELISIERLADRTPKTTMTPIKRRKPRKPYENPKIIITNINSAKASVKKNVDKKPAKKKLKLKKVKKEKSVKK